MPEIFTSLPLDSSEIWVKIWKIEESIEFFKDIPSSWFEPILKIKKTPIHQIESIAARFCLYSICQEIELSDIHLHINEKGIPYFSNSEWQISLSHSYPFVGAVLSKKNSIGIDLEKKGRKIGQIAPRFLSDTELPQFQHNSDLLTLAWSSKESVYKSLKIPGLSFQQSIRLENFNVNPLKINVLNKKITIYWEDFEEFVLTIGKVEDN